MVAMGDFPERDLHSGSRALSYDGSVIVGHGQSGWPGAQAFRWTAETDLVGLGHLPTNFGPSSIANDVSADGGVVVGESHGMVGREAFIWTEATGMVGLGHLPGGDGNYHHSKATAISGDGSIIVGTDNSTGYRKAFFWTKDSGMTAIAPTQETNAKDISADGEVIVGNYFTHVKSYAFYWTQEEGLISLGEIPGHETRYSTAYATSADGSVIVGGCNDTFGPYSGDEAFIWDEINGMRNIQDMLENECDLDLDGWTLIDARGISADGLTFTGTGINPDGNTEAWIAIVPEPATALLMGLGGLALRWKRKQ
jgi:probable HAF family extracellular repeat protein